MYKSLYADTDSVKCVTELTEERKQLMKCILNAQYGTMITNFNAQRSPMITSYKENDMRMKDFIVLHSMNRPIIVKKEAITAVSKMADGAAEVYAGAIWVTDDKYDDVIKRLFDI